jgi:hypothetical protein
LIGPAGWLAGLGETYLLQRQLYQSHTFGEAMQHCSMAICEGRHGWDNYLLLAHYHATVRCDRFPEDDASPSA